MKRLDLVIGPNGAGKSTFIALTLAPRRSDAVFVNADVIAKQRWPGHEARYSYDAAQIADRTRRELLAAGRSFIAETVASHPSKLDLAVQARKLGYTVVLHVVMVPVELSVARVTRRVRAGGHDVPEDKIRHRHDRVWPIARQAIEVSNHAYVYDNSRASGPQVVAVFTDGDPVGVVAWPQWTPAVLVDRWPRE
ncbi:AAA family ATPase [Gordonia sp. TBRC 11910]|uniref:AAA family ATPase n=1 Tax=Gordonia asplenii TaxID=2725283 RepID=A0A848KWB6_9ACTN|nr:AAA family ATPase [Gordonia asplenii]NMO02956.1 AAA family ATPase [Gordonia asplenii]